MNANKIMLASTVEHEFMDGTKVKCTLAMFRLKQLASKNKKLYETAMKVLGKGTEDIFESVKTIYAAYVCANMDSENLLSYDEFEMMCGSDYSGINSTIKALIDPKNRTSSAERSS